MKHEVKKITQIVNELISLLMIDGAEDLQVSIKRHEEVTHIDIIQKQCQYDVSFIEEMTHDLNIPRQHEIEGYYWQLVGENDCEEELCLVGAMIDEAEVTLTGEELHIHLVRKEE